MRVRPSDVVAQIDAALPNAPELQANKKRFGLDKPRAGFLRGVVTLANAVDPALLPAGEDLRHLLAAMSAIEAELENWKGGATSVVEKTPGVGDENPVIVIRRIMEGLSDAVIPEAARHLDFVDDSEYRKGLEKDLVDVEAHMRDGEWKAAMAVGGGLAEALLLDAIKKKDGKEVDAARVALEQKKDPVKFRQADPDWWDFHQYALVAEKLGIISSRTRQLALAAADGRNLLHPGKAIREKERPSRAKAKAIVAALWSIIEDLQGEASPMHGTAGSA